MADGYQRYQQGAGHSLWNPSLEGGFYRAHNQRAASPVSTGRGLYANDTPSPSRSPGPHAGAHNRFGMFGGGHNANQRNILQNGMGAAQYALHMNSTRGFQGHGQQAHTPHAQHQDHATPNSRHNFPNHQHNLSGSEAQPHAQQPHGIAQYVSTEMAKNYGENYTMQLQAYQQSAEMSGPNAHARSHGGQRSMIAAATNGLTKERDKEERNRGSHISVEVNGSKLYFDAIDVGGHKIRNLSPSLFNYTFLTRLILNHNSLQYLPSQIGRLRGLIQLDVSFNHLRELPPEIGMLTNLRELLLFRNYLEVLPPELGCLYQLEMLGVIGNQLPDEVTTILKDEGTGPLIKFLREQAPVPPPPVERDWIVLDDTPVTANEKITVMTYNTLCDKYATQSQYGYTPSAALLWTHRRDLVLEEIRGRDSDIVCLQEIDQRSYNEFFRPSLAHNDYKGVYWPKGRAKTMGDKDAELVDGCATFYKNSKFILLQKEVIDFANQAINRPDMKGEHDIFNRVMPRDDIATVSFLENRMTGARLMVVNAHIFWNPVFKDVKVIQVAILLEQLGVLAEKFTKVAPCSEKDKVLFKFANSDQDEAAAPPEEQPNPAPSKKYSSGTDIPVIMCGDFNSMPGSGVYDLIAHGNLSHAHSDLMNRKYGNFTKEGVGMSHPFKLKSSYSNIGELSFTNYTPTFTGVIDYIWYSANAFQVTGLLGEVDKDYLACVPGFPNYHFPSDHLALLAEFAVKARKDR
ncbi:glucose-repressible alcohol dehydrogenase transcriptional effector [Eremomyces bilateralis CBS 781.70]|uniref:CCR4-Not complex 3'-5'-exoribonuclease subunit Ccr4 n=1 Tax=Eremomyces bilateralis CBS 781.70 TaxID=1392243 RepID=A0A6G1GHW2_9PEZI|nr:glucose-repressible alcohol dehydrogenase transcriptional effector [Eremomyces bilateralis CBS 781.70]KAF1817643.1 glucose-repressible alcohol dehydrogenase transcriptional effector [Eremomyces bilateralis CBS 781.70]